MLAKKVMGKFYRDAAGDPSKLPWHQESPGELLAAAVEHQKGGRALDLGCGAGVFSAWMAERGMRVTGLDMFEEAIVMARSWADEKGVEVTFVQGDLFTYAPSEPFDIVLDSGCLHSLVGGSVKAYVRQLESWLAPGGDFVLGHWGKRHALDWRPIGPKRRSEAEIVSIFAGLELIATHHDDFEAPLPFGPTVRGSGYRFRAVNG